MATEREKSVKSKSTPGKSQRADTASKSPSNRAERTAERRAAIIEAALDEFISRGFTATRLDDVARRAGVAKGTHLSALQGQGIDVRGIDPDRAGAADRPAARAAANRRIGSRCDRGVCPEFYPGGGEHEARRHRAPDRGRGSEVSGHRRFLLSRGGVARPCRHARADRTRDQQRAKSVRKTSRAFRRSWWRPR